VWFNPSASKMTEIVGFKNWTTVGLRCESDSGR